MNLKFAPYSKSRLDASDCPWAFANLYISRDFVDNGFNKEVASKYSDLKYDLVKPTGQKQINLTFGTVVHSILEEIIQLKSSGKDLVDQEVVELTNKHMHPDIIHGPEGFNYFCVQRIIDKFLKSYDFSHEYLIGVEQALGVDFSGNICGYDDPNCFARMKADAIEVNVTEGVARLTDHKTQMHMSDPADSFQLALYAWIVFKNYPLVNSIVARLNFCRYGRYESTEYKRDTVLRVEAALRAKVNSIESIKDFTVARRCAYCDICAHKTTHCPLLKDEEGHEIKTPKTKEDATKLFEILIGLDAKRSDIMDKVRGWCGTNSATVSLPVDINNQDPKNQCSDLLCVGFRESESVDYDYTKVTNLMTEYNLNVNRYLLTNKKELDRIIKTKKALRELFPNDEEDVSKTMFLNKLLETQNRSTDVRFERFKTNLNKPK